jgi:diphthine synthase
MLTLIGLGLQDEKDLSLRAIEAAKQADKVYIELYTGVWSGSLKNLEKILRKKIFVLQRSDLEENSEKILNEAKRKKVALFVQGDPLIATTHSSLLVEARKRKIKTKVIHNASIVSAVAETGLHIYKFGATVTIPFPEKIKNQKPESVLQTIEENRKRGLHTLCLLDVNEGRAMSVAEAAELLLKWQFDDVFAVAFSAGKSKIAYKRISQLAKTKFPTPAVLIIPGKLHFTEEEFLQNI